MEIRQQRLTYEIKRDISIIVKKKHNFPILVTLNIILQREHKIKIKQSFYSEFIRKRM